MFPRLLKNAVFGVSDPSQNNVNPEKPTLLNPLPPKTAPPMESQQPGYPYPKITTTPPDPPKNTNDPPPAQGLGSQMFHGMMPMITGGITTIGGIMLNRYKQQNNQAILDYKQFQQDWLNNTQDQYYGGIPQMAEGGSVDEPKFVQAEKGEVILDGRGNIFDVKAKLPHTKMKGDKITDVIMPDQIVLSNAIKISKDKAKKIILGIEPMIYDEYKNHGEYKEYTLADIFQKNEHSLAELGKIVRAKFPAVPADDEREGIGFSDVRSEENKRARILYLAELVKLNASKGKIESQIKNKVEKLKWGSHMGPLTNMYKTFSSKLGTNSETDWDAIRKMFNLNSDEYKRIVTNLKKTDRRKKEPGLPDPIIPTLRPGSPGYNLAQGNPFSKDNFVKSLPYARPQNVNEFMEQDKTGMVNLPYRINQEAIINNTPDMVNLPSFVYGRPPEVSGASINDFRMPNHTLEDARRISKDKIKDVQLPNSSNFPSKALPLPTSPSSGPGRSTRPIQFPSLDQMGPLPDIQLPRKPYNPGGIRMPSPPDGSTPPASYPLPIDPSPSYDHVPTPRPGPGTGPIMDASYRLRRPLRSDEIPKMKYGSVPKDPKENDPKKPKIKPPPPEDPFQKQLDGLIELYGKEMQNQERMRLSGLRGSRRAYLRNNLGLALGTGLGIGGTLAQNGYLDTPNLTTPNMPRSVDRSHYDYLNYQNNKGLNTMARAALDNTSDFGRAMSYMLPAHAKTVEGASNIGAQFGQQNIALESAYQQALAGTKNQQSQLYSNSRNEMAKGYNDGVAQITGFGTNAINNSLALANARQTYDDKLNQSYWANRYKLLSDIMLINQMKLGIPGSASSGFNPYTKSSYLNESR